jgi:hypothetical protein
MTEGGSRARRLTRALAGAALALALAPSAASAADTYVNDDGGDDANAATDCGQAAPCLTIAVALSEAGAGDTVRVDNGLYAESVVVGSGRSLVRENFDTSDVDPEGTAVIDPGGPTAVEVLSGDPAGTIRGFTLRSAVASTVRLGDDAELAGNRIDAGPVPDPYVAITGGSPVVTANFIVDPTPLGATTTGIGSTTPGSPVIELNLLTDLARPVEVDGGSAAITRNTLTGVFTPLGRGILVSDATATITANTIAETGGDPLPGIVIRDLGLGASATLRRNLIRNFDTGIQAEDTTTLTMSGDAVLSAGGGTSVRLADTGAGGGTDLIATGVTLRGTLDTDNGADPTLDSSLLLDPIDASAGTTCAITFSRGPTTSGTDCETFQTNASPLLAMDGYHLLNGSPLIDAGNPAAPGPNDAEIDGHQRQIDGNADGVARRDIGADERLYTAPNPTTPSFTPVPEEGAAGGGEKKKKKCKPKKGKKKKCGKKKKRK